MIQGTEQEQVDVQHKIEVERPERHGEKAENILTRSFRRIQERKRGRHSRWRDNDWELSETEES